MAGARPKIALPTAGEITERPHLREVKREPTMTSPVELQRQMMNRDNQEQCVNVRLLINGSDDDGIRAYDELLPLSLVKAIINPEIADFFIPIVGSARTKPPRTYAHFLHSSAIREILILDAIDLFEIGETI